MLTTLAQHIQEQCLALLASSDLSWPAQWPRHTGTEKTGPEQFQLRARRRAYTPKHQTATLLSVQATDLV